MKCDVKGALDRQQAAEREKREKERQEYLDSLSEEERAKFLAKEKERQEKTIKSLGYLLGL